MVRVLISIERTERTLHFEDADWKEMAADRDAVMWEYVRNMVDWEYRVVE